MWGSLRWLAWAALGGALVACTSLVELDNLTSEVSSSNGAGAGGSGGGAGQGGTPPGECGRFRAFYDDFEDGTFDWTSTRPGWTVLTEEAIALEKLGNARIELTPITQSAYGRVSAIHAADLQGDAVTVRVVGVPTNGTSMARLYLAYDEKNQIGFEAHTGGSLVATTFVNGTGSQVAEVVFDPASHIHWRFAESNGRLRWMTSRDRVEWTTLASIGTRTLPFSLSHMWLNFDALSALGTTQMAEALFDDVNDPENAERWCPASSFTDDFGDGMEPGAWVPWGIGAECTAAEANGGIEVSWPASTGVNCQYRTSTAFDFGGSSVSLHVPAISADSDAIVFFRVNLDGSNWFELRRAGGPSVVELQAMRSIAGIESIMGSAPYDARHHTWWRLREERGVLYAEISADGALWEELASAPNDLPLAAAGVSFGVIAISGTGGTARFSRYNLPL